MAVLLLLVLLILVLNDIRTNRTSNSTAHRAEETTTGFMCRKTSSASA